MIPACALPLLLSACALLLLPPACALLPPHLLGRAPGAWAACLRCLPRKARRERTARVFTPSFAAVAAALPQDIGIGQYSGGSLPAAHGGDGPSRPMQRLQQLQQLQE